LNRENANGAEFFLDFRRISTCRDFNRKLAYSFTKRSRFTFLSTLKKLGEEQKFLGLWLSHQKLTKTRYAYAQYFRQDIFVNF